MAIAKIRPALAVDAAVRIDILNLQKLLSKLQATLIPGVAGSRIPTVSRYDRARIGSNLQYARSLLLQLEQQVLARAERAPSWRQQTGTEGFSAEDLQLREKKHLIRRLNQRLRESEHREEAYRQPDPVDSEDLLAEYGILDEPIADEVLPAVVSAATSSSESESYLRSRGALHEGPQTGALTTSTDAQFANPERFKSPEQSEAENRREHERLTEVLNDMAQRLTANAKQFSRSLDGDDRSILDRAVAGLDRNSTGMEAASRWMKNLTKQTEGKGWLGRMKLYLIIAVELMIIIFVLLLPKLRF